MRIIGIDFGERRIGVAAADDRVPIAVPLETIDATRDPVSQLERVVQEQRAEAIIFGLPLSLSGAEGRRRSAFANRPGVVSAHRHTIDFQDERLTTAQAERVHGGKGSQKDAIAAGILLRRTWTAGAR
jgi:putative Holliday junction resolvase